MSPARAGVSRRGALAGLAAAAGAAAAGARAQTAAPDAALPPWPMPAAVLHPSLHLVGDSTMADKRTPPTHPERGWGTLLRTLMREPQRLVNHAANGRSTKRFVDEGRWAHLLGQLDAGDHVLVQFGHNDQKADDPQRHAPADTVFRDHLRRFVADSRARGATPTLATPVTRRSFDGGGRLIDTLADHVRVTREVAAAEGCPLLDLQAATRELVQSLGPEASKSLYVWVAPGVNEHLPQGRQDNTHFVESGALAVARLAAGLLRAQRHPLAGWLRPDA